MKPATADVLHRLRQAGPLGLHSFELSDPERGRPHRDGPKRVSELNEMGFKVTSTPEQFRGSWGVRYTLRVEEGAVDGAASALPGSRAGCVTSPPESGGGSARAPAAPLARYPIKSTKDWERVPDDREGWTRVLIHGDGWHWELWPEKKKQLELVG